MKSTQLRVRSPIAAALAMLVTTATVPLVSADTNTLCADGDISNCIVAGSFPPAMIQQYSLTQEQAAAVRYIDGDWSIAGNALGTFGFNGWTPVVGDWDGDGYDNPGYFKNGIWVLKDSWDFSSNTDITVYQYGDSTWMPVVGDWNGNGTDSVGLYKDGTFKLRAVSSIPAGEKVISFGHLPYDASDPLSARPIAGKLKGTSASVGIVEGTIAAIVEAKNSGTYGFDVGDYTGLQIGTITTRNPDRAPIVYDGFHQYANPGYPKSVVLFADEPAVSNTTMCPPTQLCLWLTLGGPGTPNQGDSADVPDPEVY